MKISPFSSLLHRLSIVCCFYGNMHILKSGGKRSDIGVLFKMMSTLNIMKENLNLVVEQGGLEH